jgi:hypothetical protein
MLPNLIIFKNQTNSCVEFTYFDSVLSKTGDVFECPAYENLEPNEIVLARITKDGSIELGRYQIGSHVSKNIFDLCYNELSSVVNHLMKDALRLV